jgi:hypothetical protein
MPSNASGARNWIWFVPVNTFRLVFSAGFVADIDGPHEKLIRGKTINVLRIIDEIEQLVENGKGWMGKRMVNEEEFFTQIQRLRAAIPQAVKDAEDAQSLGRATPGSTATSRPVRDFINDSSLLSRQEQLQIISALAARLATES